MKVLNNKDSKHHLMTIPKPRKGVDKQKYVESYDEEIRDMLNQTHKKD